MTRPYSNRRANGDRDAWGTIMLGLITLGICALAPRMAYEVLYRCEVPEIQSAIDNEMTRAVLFLYITIGTVFTACFSSFIGSLPIMIEQSKIDARRIVATVQCIFALCVIVFFFMLGPSGHSIDLVPFVTKTKEFTYYIPNHYLSYLRGILALFGGTTAVIESKDKLMKAWRSVRECFGKKQL